MATQNETVVCTNEVETGKIYQLKDSDDRTLCIDNKAWAGWYWARLKRNPGGPQIARVSFEIRPCDKIRMKQHMQHPDNRGLMLFSKNAENEAALSFAQVEYEKDHFYVELAPKTSGEFVTFTAEVNGKSFYLCSQSTGDETGLTVSTDPARQLKFRLQIT